jgi:hypothetical protein
MIGSIERRRSERLKVMFSATVEQSGNASPTRLANLSSEGALLVGANLSDGAPVLLQRNGTNLPGSVTWSRGNECGVKFDDFVDVSATLRTVAQPRRTRDFHSRRPGLKCAPMSEADRAMFERWLNTGPRLVLG